MNFSFPWRLKTHPKLMQQLLIMRAADQFAKCRLDFDQVRKILDLTEGLTGSWVPITKDYVVFRDRDHLVLRRAEEIQDFRFAVLPNHQYSFDRFAFSSELIAAEGVTPDGDDAEYVDADAIGPPELVLRSWQEGDAFIPLGMKSAKKISDFSNDLATHNKNPNLLHRNRTGRSVSLEATACGLYRLSLFDFIQVFRG